MGIGLPTGLAATIYGMASLSMAYFLLRRFPERFLFHRILVFAGVTCALVHLLPEPWMSLIALTLLLPAFRPKENYFIPGMFVAFLLLMPDHLAFDIPFPGIAYLLEYRWWLPLILLFLFRLRRRSDVSFNGVDICFCLYLALIVVLDFRHVPITSGMRRAFYTIVLNAGPYFLLSRGVFSVAHLRVLLDSLFVTSVILAAYAALSQFAHWDFMAGPAWYADYRMGGLLRIGVTMSTGLLGFTCGLGAIILWIYRKRYGLSWPVFLTLNGILLLGVLSSGARVAIVATAVTAVFVFLFRYLTALRYRLAVGGTLLGSGALLERAMSFNTSGLDEIGTFEYRQGILRASIDVIRETPFFGRVDFLDSWRLAHLVQGQGIVDIVNRYLQIALEYGLIATGLFIAAYVIALGKCVARWRSGDFLKAGAAATPVEVPFVFSVLVGYVFFIATTSNTSYVGAFGTIILAIVRATAELPRKPAVHRDTSQVPHGVHAWHVPARAERDS